MDNATQPNISRYKELQAAQRGQKNSRKRSAEETEKKKETDDSGREK